MKSAPRILHLITAFERGGAENHLAELVRHQRASGFEVTIGYFRGTGWWAGPMRALGVTVHDFALRFYGDPAPVFRLRRVIAEGGFDLIHAHLPPAELYARLALLGTPPSTLPLIISKHNDSTFHRLPGELAMERWVARRAARIIVISDAVRRFMEDRRVGTSPARLETILYGVDLEPFSRVAPPAVAALRAEWGAGPDTLVFGFVGRLVPQKSIDTLLRAFARFAREFPGDARLVITGRGPLEAGLRALAEAEGIADRVVWTGPRADIPTVMRAFDVFAITSVFEGFGLVLIEAMAAGKPVVATRVSAIPEVVLDEVTGLLAPARDVEKIAATFARLTDRPLRERLGAAGLQRARDVFTLERMCRATDAVYAPFLGHGHPAATPLS